MAGSLPELVLRHFRADAPGHALTVEGCSYSYSALGRMARRLAENLEDRHGPLTGRPIAIAASGSLTAYLAVLACLQLGATYVPLDPTAPPDRVEDMLRRVAPAAVVIDPRHLHRLPSFTAHAPTYDPMNARWYGDVARPPGVDPASTPPRYVLFTSGSTGTPKGIGIPDRCIAAMFEAMAGIAPVVPEDRVAQAFELTFDLAQYSMLACWIAGAELVVMTPADRLRPADFVRHHRVTYWFSVPSVAGFAQHTGDLTDTSMPSVRVSLFCGEALPGVLATSWRSATAGAPTWNLYGPTEATIACAAHRLADSHADDAGTVPLGRPFPGTSFAVLGADGTPAPLGPGTTGELLIGGAQLFTGYLGDEATTRAAFVAGTPGAGPGRWYRSGDRVRVDDEGTVHFLGRVDEQVQVRGHRVELREVELRIAQGLGADPSRIVAVPLLGAHGTIDALGVAVALPDVSDEHVRKVVVDRLPTYMVPRLVRTYHQFPLNSNGKTDRAALRAALNRE
jgi:amino acid adenylation domain-containing protein